MLPRAIAALAVLPVVAHAHPTVDWTTGMVLARGVGLADRNAPNPAVARGTSRRKAEHAAKAALAAQVALLPLAGGGTLADKLGDPAIKARVARAVDEALSVSAEPETDGAWTVTLAVPTEALRLAIAGPRALAGAGDTGPAMMIVEAVTATPALGVTVGGIAGATVWVTTIPAWAKDAPKITATGAKAGAIDAKVGTATASTLFVLVTTSRKRSSR